MNLSGNNVSDVYESGDRVVKRQPKYLCDNEVHALTVLAETGIVPQFFRIDNETISMERIVSTPITNTAEFVGNVIKILAILDKVGIRHGDLTMPHLFVVDYNKIKIIDWAESRLKDDPRPDKRREGDAYWLSRTVMEILSEI